MSTFEVYATRWDTPGMIAHLIPAKQIQFSRPLCAHGEASFTATVEPGKSFWRSSLAGPRSGVLIAETNSNGLAVPRWAGRLKSEQEQPGRKFSFSFSEWGSALNWFPAPVHRWEGMRDTDIMVDALAMVQAVPGQNLNIVPAITAPSSSVSTAEVTADMVPEKKAGDWLEEFAARAGGPEWYYTIGGTLKNPMRELVAADHLGHTTPKVTLEHVEDTAAPPAAESAAELVPLHRLFRGVSPQRLNDLGRIGGNVVEVLRGQNADDSATAQAGAGDGVYPAQPRVTSVASTLLAHGWPLITRSSSYSSVTDPATLRKHTDADLAASAGLVTTYSLLTLGSQPEWRNVPRGSVVRMELDTDRYAGPRPLKRIPRVLSMTVAVDDDGGPEQVRWDVADVLEV